MAGRRRRRVERQEIHNLNLGIMLKASGFPNLLKLERVDPNIEENQTKPVLIATPNNHELKK